jgi:D-aminoacyl-tRNA deacylase
MKALIQRVKNAKVQVEGETTGEIKEGILIFLGITHEDSEKDIDYLVEKISNLRIFRDGDRYFEKSLLDVSAEVLIVSQFTLYGSTKKGRRPDFFEAAKPEQAEELYEKFVNKFKEQEVKTETGVFGAMMEVSLINDGPVTLMIESK